MLQYFEAHRRSTNPPKSGSMQYTGARHGICHVCSKLLPTQLATQQTKKKNNNNVILFINRQCFGKNDKGQLGLDDTENRGDDPSEMGDELPAVSLGVNQTAVAVSAEGDRTCVLLESGESDRPMKREQNNLR